MRLRELFQAQIAQRQQVKSLFYFTPDGYGCAGLVILSISAANLDRCGLIPAADQSHMRLGSTLPILYNPADYPGVL